VEADQPAGSWSRPDGALVDEEQLMATEKPNVLLILTGTTAA